MSLARKLGLVVGLVLTAYVLFVLSSVAGCAESDSGTGDRRPTTSTER